MFVVRHYFGCIFLQLIEWSLEIFVVIFHDCF